MTRYSDRNQPTSVHLITQNHPTTCEKRYHSIPTNFDEITNIKQQIKKEKGDVDEKKLNEIKEKLNY